MNNEARELYASKAKEAFNKAYELDPTYAPTLAYIKALNT
jgi:hypothetical protein